MTPNTLNIIKIDNVDILQPYAMVSALSSRSWHGTSVQCIQPRPITIKLPTDTTCSQSTSDDTQDQVTTPSKRGYSVPTLSPVSTQLNKRCRTFTENSTYSAVVIPDITDISFHSMSNVDYVPSQLSQFSVRNFNLVSSETDSIQVLKTSIFQYTIAKAFSQNNDTFPSLNQFLTCANYSNLDTEKASIHFMKVISLRADSHDTITIVLKDIYDKFICQQNLKWIVVVGDAKTYDITQKIKKEYYLHWLVIFPGDWHILYNYQKAIIKAYWDAGLMQLAQVAGFKAETLTSLSNASNFR